VQINRSIWRVPAHGGMWPPLFVEIGVTIIMFPSARARASEAATNRHSRAIDDLLPDYERSLLAEGRRPRGRKRYLDQLADFHAFVTPLGAEEITPSHCRRYQEHLSERGNSSSTRQVSLSAMRSFFAWCVVEGIREDNPATALKWPKRDDPPSRRLDSDTLGILRARLAEPAELDSIEQRAWRRNVRCIVLMLHAGLRITEATELCWTDVDWRRKMLTVIGKGGKKRYVPINRTLAAELQKVPESEREGAIIPTPAGKPFASYKTLARSIFERWMYRTLQLHITAHQLRHAFALRMLDKGADVRRIQVVLGPSART
jgi:site-specific recombinase XerD